jgi:hypothetical protein
MMEALVDLGSTWTSMMVSERWPATWEAFPKFLASWADSPARLSLPTMRMVIGLPGGSAVRAPAMEGIEILLIWLNRQVTYP